MERFHKNTPTPSTKGNSGIGSSLDPRWDPQSSITRAPYPDRPGTDPPLILPRRTTDPLAQIPAAAGNIPPIRDTFSSPGIDSGRFQPTFFSPTADSFSSPGIDSALIHRPLFAPTGDGFSTPGIDSGVFHRPVFPPYHYGGLSSRGSPASSMSVVENLQTSPQRSPPVFSTPVKVEEDVFVMDELPVNSSSGSRTRSTSDSSSSSSGNSLYKTRICLVWQANGNCNYGSGCRICKPFLSGRCRYGANCRNFHQVAAAEPKVAAPAAQPKVAAPAADKQGETSRSSWSPLDDGIDCSLLSSTDSQPSREEVDAYINDMLYGPPRTRRLPCFTEFCPD